jgi:hypothetical protein
MFNISEAHKIPVVITKASLDWDTYNSKVVALKIINKKKMFNIFFVIDWGGVISVNDSNLA